MKAIGVSILIAAVATSGAALAKPKPNNPAQQNAVQLRHALSTVAVTANSSGPPPSEHFKPKADNDQGDDNANPRAILRVCSHDNPSAHRSAICPTGVSPD